MDPQSSFAFLVSANEAFGYTHNQTLESSMSVIGGMFKEYNFRVNERNKSMSGDEELKEEEEWIWITDFETGQEKRVKRVKSL